MPAHAWLAEVDEAETVARLMVAFRDSSGRDWPSDNAFLASVERLIEDPQTEYFDGGLHPDPATSLVSLRTGITLDKWEFNLFMDNVFDAHPQLNLAHQDEFTLLYTAEGNARMGKERIEAFAGGQSLVIDDFRRLERYRNGRRADVKRRQDKGHRRELERFLSACLGQVEPPDSSTYFASTVATIAAAESMLTGRQVVTA